MPHPLTIEIGANTNIAPRIKQLLEGRTLRDAVSGQGDIVVRHGRTAIQLPGKTAAVYVG